MFSLFSNISKKNQLFPYENSACYKFDSTVAILDFRAACFYEHTMDRFIDKTNLYQ